MSVRLPGQYHTQAVTKTADHRHSARTRSFHPQPAGEGGKTEHEYRHFESKGDLGDGPPISARERNSKHAPRVNRAERDLHHNPRHGDKPTGRRQGRFRTARRNRSRRREEADSWLQVGFRLLTSATSHESALVHLFTAGFLIEYFMVMHKIRS